MYLSFFRLKMPILTEYAIDGTTLNRLEQISVLSIVIDFRFTFAFQYDTVFRKAFRMICFIIRNTWYFNNTSTSQILFYSFVRCKFEYGPIIWNPIYQCDIDGVQCKFVKSTSVLKLIEFTQRVGLIMFCYFHVLVWPSWLFCK